MENHTPDGLVQDIKGTAAATLWIAEVAAKPLQFLGHVDPGERFLGINGMLSVPLMVLTQLLFPQSNPILMILFIWAYIIKGVVHRAINLYHWWRGDPLVEHTRRPGTPLLAISLRQAKLEYVYWLEPVVFFVLGLVLFSVAKAFGFYLMTGSIGLLICLSTSAVYQRNLAMDRHDAAWLARRNAESFRNVSSLA